MTPDSDSSAKSTSAQMSDGPTVEQFIILAQKVEELEDRIRSLAVNDFDRLRSSVLDQAATQDRDASRNPVRSGWARLWRGRNAE